MKRIAVTLVTAMTLVACSSGEAQTPYASPQSFTSGQRDYSQSTSSSVSASEQDLGPVSVAPIRSCPSTEPRSIVTDEGSKDVRVELDRLTREVACKTETLRNEHIEWEQRVREQDDANRRQDQIDAQKFAECLSGIGLTQSQWYDRYTGVTDAPCSSEALYAAVPNFVSSQQVPSASDPIRTTQRLWLQSLDALIEFASLYPDSVEPVVLSQLLLRRDSVKDCLRTADWCWSE